MKISPTVLRRFTDVPDDPRELRDLLEDVGIEVKRIEPHDEGLVLTLELLANRGDHHSYAGIAREVVGRTGGPLRLPEIAPLEVGTGPWPVVLESPRCLRYTATLLERSGEPRPFPRDVLLPIELSGGDSIHPAVDATNLSNLELGQPTHAFDADALEGPIRVRESRAGERAWLLFQEAPVELPEGTLVIADDAKILAVAGVIGCEESKTTPATRRILLESATFDPVAVRVARRALGVQTDSATRFERGADPDAALTGAARVVHLLERYGGFVRQGGTGEHGDWPLPDRQIPLEIPTAANAIGYPLTIEEVQARLSRYGFTVSDPYPHWPAAEGWRPPPELEERSAMRLRNTVLVKVPSHRIWDVEFVDDLVEELAKSVGYEATPLELPPIELGALPSASEVAKRQVEEVLVGLGFYEIITDGFYGRGTRERLGIREGHPLWDHVETENALDRGYSLLKNNALAQAVEAVATNLRMRNDEVKAYEWTRTFHLDPEAPNGVCRERRVLWAVASGHATRPDWSGSAQPADVHFLCGVVEEIALELGLPLVLGPPDPRRAVADLLHPGRQAAIRLGERVVGLLGEVHPEVLRNYRIKRERPVYFELDADALVAPRRRPPYDEPPEHHPIVRSLAFTLPHGVQAGAIADHLRASGPSWLRDVAIVDRYDHTLDERPVRTITFELRYAQEDEGRTAEEVNAASEYLVRAVEQRFGERGVRLRGA